MNVCLVYPKFKYACGDPPLGILYIAAYLRQHEIPVSVIDTTFNPSICFVRQKLFDLKPGIVGIYCDTMMYNDCLSIAALAKSVNANVIVGGPHAAVAPETLIMDRNVDSVCVGEAELAMLDYVSALQKGASLSSVDGIWHKSGNTVVKNRQRRLIQDLDSLPFPARDLIDFERHISNWYHFSHVSGIRGTSILASRGCVFSCSYCQPTLDKIFGKGLRHRSPENVVQELLQLHKIYRINAFHLQDDTATVSDGWLFDFCRLMSRQNFVWSCNSRIDTLNEEKVIAMKKAGVREIYLGIESASDRILKEVYNKTVSIDPKDAIKILKRHGLRTLGYFMLGAPTETYDEARSTINFAVKSDLDMATFSISTPFPGTYMHSAFVKTGCLYDFSECDYYRSNKHNISQIPGRDLELLKRKAYLRFYLHPKRIRCTLSELRHLGKVLLKLKRF